MLTRISANRSVYKLLLRSQLPVCSVRSTSDVAEYQQQKEEILAKLKEELPKPYDGPERDLVNFPRRKRPVYPGKVRMGFIPDEWFQFFYKKTGVTGPYLFGIGLINFLVSKELYVIEEEFSTGLTLALMTYFAIKKFGPKVRSYADKLYDEDLKALEEKKAQGIKRCNDLIADEKKLQWQATAKETLVQAKRENVAIQLEAEYRRRLMDVYQSVKKRLDYMLEMDSTRRKLEQKHMVDWIVTNVLKSITPQQEKEALQKCIEDLKVLSARAA